MLDAVRDEMEKFARLVIKRSRYNLTRQKHNVSGQLYKELTYEIKQVQDNISLIIEMPEYGEFLDKGVSGTEVKYNTPYKYTTKKPPYKAILNWVRARKIRFRDTKGRFAVGTYENIAGIMQNSIYKKGIKPSKFFTKPFERHYDGLADSIARAFRDDIEL